MIELTFNAAQELLAIRELAQRQALMYPEGLFFKHTDEVFDEARKIVSYYNWHSDNKPEVLESFKSCDDTVLRLRTMEPSGEVCYQVLNGYHIGIEERSDFTWRMIGSYPTITRYKDEDTSHRAFLKMVSKLVNEME